MDEVRTGKREGSVVSADSVDSLLSDDRVAWRQLRKALEDVGITPQMFERYRELILKTLLDAIKSGTLQEQLSSDEETDSGHVTTISSASQRSSLDRHQVPSNKDASSEVDNAVHPKPDRSPLQRLELTLNSITKEEKRTRVEPETSRSGSY